MEENIRKDNKFVLKLKEYDETDESPIYEFLSIVDDFDSSEVKIIIPK